LEFKRNQVAIITSSLSSEQIDTYAYTEPDRAVQPPMVSQGNRPVLDDSSEYGLSVMIGLWILGVLAVLIITQYHHRRMISRAIADTVPVPAWIQEIFLSCRDQLKIRTWPELTISQHIASPCLVGAIRPRILLPSKLLENTTECEMRHILLHECIHLQQRDVWYAWLWTVTLALHWFNPLLWWAGRRLSQDCEAACDERVLAVLDPDKRISYGRSLLVLAQRLRPAGKTQLGFICIVEHVTKIERRLTMIKNYRKCHVPMMGKIALILLAALVLTSYAGQHSKAPISAEKAEMMGRVEDYFLHNFRDMALRKSLEWGPVETNDQGHRSIRYKYEALFSDQVRKTINQVFAFDGKGNYLGSEILGPVFQERKKQDITPEKSNQFLENFVTVDKDGGLTWQKARAITKNTWFVGSFANKGDERWYTLNVSKDVTYSFFMDDEFGSGKYTADPDFELFEQKVDESTRMISESRNDYYDMPLEYRPKGSCTVYIRIISDNPGSTSFALGFTELPGAVSE
jgi:beta-lactamase regulating signal transducer with metallopeptidase domain